MLMPHVRQAARAIALATVVVTTASTWASASVAPKWSASELADFSDVIVTGRVESVASGWDPAVHAIYTYVVVDVDDVFKGPVGRGRLIVKQLGGIAGDMGLAVFDQPTFTVGESVLLYLETRPRDGSLYTAALWQGKWTVEGDVAVRYEPAGHRSAFPVDRQSVKAVADLGARVDTDAAMSVNTAPSDAMSAAWEPFVTFGFRYLFNPAVDVQSGGQSGLSGGGFSEIQASIARWNAVGATFRFSFGSTSGPARCASQVLNNSRVTISFNDPCAEISNSGGTLAIGGSYFFNQPGSGGTVNGQSFFRAAEGFVVNNDSSIALQFLRASGCFADIQLHELGHVLGLNHSADNSAIMFASINNTCLSGAHNLASDDRNGILFIYPSTNPGLTPPSSAPGNLSVAVNGTTSITVSFNAVNSFAAGPSAATSYRLDFRQSVGGPVVASLTTPNTSTVIPLPPGTVGTFNVVATGINSAGAGPSSSPVTFTIGSGGPCTSAPASPNVSGNVVNGVATVTWPQVPGATFYIVSAGTSQGGTNLFPSTNIGTTNTVQASGLPPGFTAWVRVIAGNACGQSAPRDFFLQ
jgi:hypothetical protein